MAVLVGIVLFVTFVAIVIAYERGRAEKRRELLHQLAGELGGAHDVEAQSASGTHRGVPVTVHFGHRGSGKRRQPWTFVQCPLPAGDPLVLHLRRHVWLDDGKIERGEMVDVVVGDPTFDQAFLVEGAPAEIVKRLLGAEARAGLLAHRRVDVGTEDGTLRLAVHGWLVEPGSAMAAISCASGMAAGAREVDDRPPQEARSARVAEVRELEAIRAARVRRQKVAVIVFVVLVFGVWAVLMFGVR